MDREPLILEPETSIREAARSMTEEGRPAALVRLTDDDMGLVTDADLRELGLAEGRSPDDPVRSVAQTEPLIAPGDHTVGEVLIDLLEAHRRDICVTDRNGRIVGLLGIEDLAGGEHSSFALRELEEADVDSGWSRRSPRASADANHAALPARHHRCSRRKRRVTMAVGLAFESHGRAGHRSGLDGARQSAGG
jgi:hypothetical protein